MKYVSNCIWYRLLFDWNAIRVIMLLFELIISFLVYFLLLRWAINSNFILPLIFAIIQTLILDFILLHADGYGR